MASTMLTRLAVRSPRLIVDHANTCEMGQSLPDGTWVEVRLRGRYFKRVSLEEQNSTAVVWGVLAGQQGQLGAGDLGASRAVCLGRAPSSPALIVIEEMSSMISCQRPTSPVYRDVTEQAVLNPVTRECRPGSGRR
jgi:hypothetical protein